MGRALKHLASLRLNFRKGSFIDEDNKELANSAEEPAGNLVDIRIVKTKVCKQDRRIGQYTINYNKAIDYLSDTVYMAIKYGFINQAGSYFSLVNPETGELLPDPNGEVCRWQGKAGLLTFLRETPDYFNDLYEAVNESLKTEH